jgi:hypothetical protein
MYKLSVLAVRLWEGMFLSGFSNRKQFAVDWSWVMLWSKNMLRLFNKFTNRSF